MPANGCVDSPLFLLVLWLALSAVSFYCADLADSIPLLPVEGSGVNLLPLTGREVGCGDGVRWWLQPFFCFCSAVPTLLGLPRTYGFVGPSAVRLYLGGR